MFTDCITRCPQYAPAFNDRAMAYQLKHAQSSQNPTSTTAPSSSSSSSSSTAPTTTTTGSSTSSTESTSYADLALADLDRAIALGVGQQSVLKQAYTQRAILKKLKGKTDAALGLFLRRVCARISAYLCCVSALWCVCGAADFEKAAKLGSEFARTEAVRLNPYAAMCNAMLAEAMDKMSKAPASKSAPSTCSTAAPAASNTDSKK